MSNSAQSLSDERLVSGVHLVGSIPLADADQVFRRVTADLGDRLRRIPDGETGPRADWIIWQYPILSSRPEFEICPPGPDHHLRRHPYHRFEVDLLRDLRAAPVPTRRKGPVQRCDQPHGTRRLGPLHPLDHHVATAGELGVHDNIQR